MEIPTIKEELSRKSLDALQNLLLDRSTGKITEAQFATGLNVLWEVASGLVDREFFEMISMATVNQNDPSLRRTTFMTCRDHWILVVVDVTALSVIVHRNGGSPRKEIICDSITEALEKAQQVCLKAGLAGYQSIN